jgi:hypothetical protein
MSSPPAEILREARQAKSLFLNILKLSHLYSIF